MICLITTIHLTTQGSFHFGNFVSNSLLNPVLNLTLSDILSAFFEKNTIILDALLGVLEKSVSCLPAIHHFSCSFY